MPVRRIYNALLICFSVLGVISTGSAQQSARVAPADIIISRAKVYTLNPETPWAQAIAIRHGKIVAIGSEEVVGKMRGIGTRVIDAGGKLALPGFTDCHVHFYEGSESDEAAPIHRRPALRHRGRERRRPPPGAVPVGDPGLVRPSPPVAPVADRRIGFGS